jgi:hypothetical protein
MKRERLWLVVLLSLTGITAVFAGNGEGASGSRAGSRTNPYFEYYRRASYSNFSFAFGTGLSAYTGDLSSPMHFRRQRYHLNPHGSVNMQYRFTNYISARVEGSLFKLYSEPAPGTWNDKAFKGNNAEYYLGIVHDLYPKSEVEFYARRWNPYVFAGIGLLHYNPTDPETRESYRPQGNNAGYIYPKVARTIPLGIGINYYPHDHISIGFEAGYRFTNTDYLDDASWEGDPNPKNDGYFMYGSKLTKQLLPRKYNYKKRVKAGQRY